ncbi:DNA polymerase III subunit alpha [Streptomyces chumphonensis]|uniref:DNA polymerase III subunit alpha n=1 Tax=Streptomyces chumphonensis TaxID=1214925 RepID=A0A927EXI3_9ACTN|nr:DNA polymerase III subunit alpha [Streptomyces chumphonensis]MBD3931488.1 DNA polymerase III subunit alpha [Streptomyces chumphonensis]
MSGFTHLHAVSGFSVRYGASHPERLAERAAERGMDALALTDRDTLAGAVRFAGACEKAGVRAVYGVELAVAEHPGAGDPGAAPGAPRRRTPARGGAFVDEPAQRVVFLARDGAAGWAELCRLVSAAHRGTTAGAHAGAGRRPVLEWADVPASGVTVLLGPGSDVGRALAAGRPDRAARLLVPWREVFGDALRLEVVGSAPRREAARMLGLAAEQGVAPVLTNAVRYADPGLGPVADVLDAARTLVPVDPARGLDGGERWLKGPREMARVAEEIAEAAGFRRDLAYRLLARTEESAARCRVDSGDDLGVGSAHFPEPYLVGAGARTADRVLRSRCTAQMAVRRYDRDRHRWDRLEQELRIIGNHGFATYFLTVAQVVDDVRALGIRVAARGSGAGSLVNHLLGISAADPVEHGLLMERFLSEHRGALPDIDVDVESARRLEVYRAIFERFGEERVATVAMPETYRVRHAVRDVGAALGLDPAEIDRLAKAFPHIRARDARSALAELPELRGVDVDRYGPKLWDLVESLDGLVRGTAMHPCGVLLSDARLRARTPVVPTGGEGFAMAQFDKDDVEKLGLLKLDVLGVRMQSTLAYAAAEVERATGRRVDLDALDVAGPGDERTYRLIRSAETLGCFQIESPGQRDLLGRLQPSTFHDLVVDISLFRPGPVAADMVRPFIEARHGRTAPTYPHEDLKDALAETCGVVVFHEQVIRIVDTMTGCGKSFADETRRALADPGLQPRIRAWFERESARRGYAPEVVARTWGIVEAFGAYGFCKAHAVAFAVPTYQSAWLKAHHPAAFYAGVLTHDPGMYPKRLLLADARRHGVPVLPLDVNRSDVGYRIELESESPSGERRWGVRLALGEVRGISEADAARIAAGQPYRSLHDLLERARPPRPVAENLVKVGALDAFGDNRRDLLLHLAELHRGGRRGSGAGQLPLTGEVHATAPPPAGLPDLDHDERLGAELGVLGMDASRHLMTDHHAFLGELGVRPARRLATARHGETVLVAGAKVATQTPPIRSGKRVVFVTLDDGTGLTDLAFFEDSHAACAHTVFHSWLLLVRGVVQRRGPRSFSVVGAAAWDLAELVELRRAGGLDAVAARLAEPPPGAGEEPGDGAPDRRIRMATGYAMHPWADLRPAGEPPKKAGPKSVGPGSVDPGGAEGPGGAESPASAGRGGRKLWHSSPGSAG